ncbi:MAG: prepilin-type N-terminal cleavage/methylation domain-containing protein [Oribacterium sp.]|nr:prepilin-type N-terminal cleavage/methylation domain-containing protein [Oribacterium sp.]
MINTVKKRLNRKGFTLAEVLVTVAIILILAGVTFVSVVQYQKNLRLMEMDGTAKEIFIAAQNHLSVAQASGDLDRLAEEAKKPGSASASTIGTKLDSTSVSAYAGNDKGEYYSVIHNVASGSESYIPTEGKQILQMMLPFGALDETVATGGNYAIVYELKSASVVAVLYSGAGNASFGNAAVINFDAADVSKIKDICNDKSTRKNYVKNGVTAIVGCYIGTAGSAAIPTETLEAPKLEVKNENKLHVIVSDEKKTDTVTLIIRGVQSGTVAQRILKRSTSDGNDGSGTFDVTLDDITGDGSYRFANIISSDRDRFTKTKGDGFIPGENIEISARVSSTTGFAAPKESAKYTVSSLFDDVNETKDAGNTTVYIRNLRHLENLGANVSDFTAALGNGTTSGSSKVVNIIAEQKNDITMFSMSTSGSAGGNHFENLRGSKIYGMEQEASFAALDVNYPLVYHGNQHEIHDVSIGAQKDHTAGGIFGQVADPASGAANASLSVSDLILRNNRVSGRNVRNAGMLVGETTKNLTVDGVLAYYHEDDYNDTRDSSVEVTASENAGGLIGLVAGGKLDVKNSAAAVYVKGGSAAGGFIGSVAGAAADSTIVQSYAGGHTKDGAYSTTDATTNRPVLTGAGRYNVQATQASGNAGGFIGVTTNNVSMNAVYSTASAYSNDATKSGSFSGNTNANFGTANNYYAIGPHNGTAASADDTAKAEIPTGQVRRQATPYDRKLLKDDASEPTMKKMTYPLCTINHMCSDTNLPWFIKEHVGDWVVSKTTKEADFEVENGNRLTVRINTGRPEITEDLYYAVKVHEETVINNQDDAYFLLHVNSDNTVNVKRKYNNESNWSTYNHNIAVCKMSTESPLVVELYLDDITNPYGHFGMIFDGNKFIPGEDISINVIPLTNENDENITYDETQKIYTNSLFGYLQNSTEYSSDDHNKQKIDAVKSYDSEAGTQENGEGLIPALNDKYYVQIDNSRHLENLSYSIGYSWPDTIGQKIVGAIQTDNIYWSGETNPGAYTQSIQKELGENLSVWPRNDPHNPKTNGGCFSPLDYNVSMTFYDGGDHFINGLKVSETSMSASLFIMPDSTEMTIKNLTIKNSSFISSGRDDKGRAACLISYTANKLTIENTHCKNVIVNGTTATGGLVGQANGTVNITNCSVNGNITSQNGQAGGFVGCTGNDVTIESASCDGVLTVSGFNSSGGVIGQTNQSKVKVDKATFLSKIEVTSENAHAGGVIGIAGSEAEINLTVFKDILTVSGANSSGGIIGNANGKVTVDQATFESDVMVKATSENVHAGGIVGYTGGEADIKNATFKGRLTVSGKNSSAGIIGNTNAKATVKHASFQLDVTVTSTNDHAAGVLGYTYNEADIENITFVNKLIVYGNKSSGGILGNTGSKLKLCDISIGGGSTITSVNGDAGGVVGFAQSYDADIQNIKFIGKDTQDTKDTEDTEVIAKKNAGGLCGTLTENKSKLTISNVAVSAFIQAEENAGGLIGQLNTEAYEGQLKNSYYGGRTQYGQYGPITINHNKKLYTYTANIHGNQAAGGLIGYIQNANGLTIDQCFSTGSVENISNNQTAGGFIGVATPWNSGVKIKNCYSMGSVSGTNNGGFIGNKNEKVLFDDGVYYLKVFNETIPAIGNTFTGDNSKLIVLDLVDAIKGSTESKDLSEETMVYDKMLNGQAYPYKNWTTNWESTGISKPIVYYGDWPSPKSLTGEFIYFHAVNTDKSFNKKGDMFKLTGEKTNTECFLKPADVNMDLEKIGFGIISEVVIQDDAGYEAIKKLYSWSLYPNGPFDGEDHYCKIAGSATDIKYSEFNYYGKKYYYYRCTDDSLKKLENGVVYVKDNTTMVIYKISVVNGHATFERI